MHGRNSPRRRASHDNTPNSCWREGGGRKRACGRRASQCDDPARLTKPASATERKRSPTIVAAHAAVKVHVCRPNRENAPLPHKICHWATGIAPIGQIMGDKPETGNGERGMGKWEEGTGLSDRHGARCAYAALSATTAARTSCAVDVEGSGRPMRTVTLRGRRWRGR